MEFKRVRKDRSKFVAISVAVDEKEFISQAAEEADEKFSDFCRRVLIEASNKILNE